MTWATLLARHLRGSAARWAALALVVAVTAALVLVWPRWLDRTATEELRRDLGGTSTALVDPVAVTTQLPLWHVEGTDTHAAQWAATLDPLREYAAGLPEPLRSLLGEPAAQAIHRGIGVAAPEVTDRAMLSLQPTFSSGFRDRAVFVEGRAPEERVATPEDLAALWEEGDEPIRLEFALSVEAAEEMRWAVGQARPLVAALPWYRPVEAVLTGTFTADDPAAGFWQHSSLLLNPTVVDNPNAGIVVSARAVIAAGYDTQLAMITPPESSRIWYPLDITGLTATDAAVVAEQLRTDLAAIPQEWGLSYQVATEAPRIIDGVLGRRAATEAVLGLAVAAPAGVLLALLALASQVIVAPRRGALNLVRERGAAASQTRRLLGTEAALISVPAAALGGAGAVLALPDAQMSPAWWLAPAVIAAAPVVSLLGGSRPPRPRLRLVAEIAVTVLAVAAATLQWRRGITAAGADPLGVATPLLAAVVVAIACTRLLPPLLRPIAHRAAARPDLVVPLGSALAARRRPSVVAAMAMLAGTAVAALGVLATATVTEARHDAALRDVGADVRVSGFLDEPTLAALRDLPGVAGLAQVANIGVVAITAEDVATDFANLYAAAPALGDVQAHVPGAVPTPEAGTAVVSARLGLAVGDELTVHPGVPLTVPVAAVLPDAPGIAGSGGWAVVDHQDLIDLDLPVRPTTTLLALAADAPADDAADRVRAVVGPVPTIATAAGRVTELDRAPTARALSAGLAVVALVGIGSATAAVALGLARRDGDRTRIVAVLRTMGLPPRAEHRLVLWEVVPLLALAVVAGVGLGFGLAGLLLGTTDLRPFTGGSTQPALVVHGGALVAALGAVVLVAGVGVVVSAWAAARRSAAVVLRAGEEPT